MLVSEEKRFLFIHIQKTGGSSLTRHLKACVPDINMQHKAHSPLHLADEKYHDYYKAAFVRNPFERLVSWYTDIDTNSRYRQNLDNHLRSQVVKQAQSFTEFILHCGDLQSKSGFKAFSTNQADYLTNAQNRIDIDFIGRFEHFQKDALYLCRHLGIDTSIPHINASKHGHYRDYYTSETRKTVETRFEKDLDYFKYSF